MNEKANSLLAKCLILLLIAAFSVVLFWGMSGFKNELFLIDDNRYQWYPVIDQSYQTFFETGHMPQFNFYQFKGIEICDEGYYSLNNPIMLISYVLNVYVFKSPSLPTLTIYIFIMIASGNVFAYLLCRKLNASVPLSIFIVLMYTSSSTFFRFGYWYYVFNNYLIIPLLLYCLIRTLNTKILSYVIIGVILAFSILLGNVQYTVYHYVLYCIIMLCVSLYTSKRNLLKLITNCFIGIILSFPYLYLLLQSSKRSASFSSKSEFFTSPLTLFGSLVSGILPNSLINRLSPSAYKVIAFISSINFYGDKDCNIYYNGPFIVCIIALLVYLIRKLGKHYELNTSEYHKQITLKDIAKKIRGLLATARNGLYKNNPIKGFFIGISISILFFFSFSIGGVASRILYMFPVINKFRYLFKAYFIVIPLLICIVIISFKYSRLKKTLAVICSFFVILGIINNYYIARKCLHDLFETTITSSSSQEIEDIKEELINNNVDFYNYRILALVEKNSLYDLSYAFDPQKKISRNYGVLVGVFTIGGYEMTSSQLTFNQSNMLSNEEFMFRYSNTGDYNTFCYYSKNFSDRVIEQINDNAVKYFIVDNNEKITASFKGAIAKIPGIEIEREFEFLDSGIMFEISNVNSLVMANDFPVELNSQLDRLEFRKNGNSTQFTLSFTYNEGFVAQFVSDDGTINKPITVTKNDKGFTIIHSEDSEPGTIYLTYSTPMFKISMYFEVIISMLFIICIIRMVIKPYKPCA